jgi:hypothetical protein
MVTSILTPVVSGAQVAAPPAAVNAAGRSEIEQAVMGPFPAWEDPI